MLSKPVDVIGETDLDLLVVDAVDEQKTIDYKAGWDLKKPEWKDEFRRDITSFANTAGGHLVYGMTEVNGFPQAVLGMDIANPDETKLRLSEILQSLIRPRLVGVGIRMVPLHTGKYAVVIRVPRSFSKPHQVQIGKDDFQYWARNAGGKYRLDVDELRIAFTLSATLAEHVRSFRLDRLGAILSGEAPVPMIEGGKFVLHLVPASAFDPSTSHDVARITSRLNRRNVWGNPLCFNFEGYIASFDAPATSYLQVFQEGALEAVSAKLINQTNRVIPSERYEAFLLAALPELLSVQQELGVEPPIFLMLSLVGIEGYAFGSRTEARTFRRNEILIPAQIIDTFEINPITALLPIFNRVWNTAGYQESVNFKDGQWVGQS